MPIVLRLVWRIFSDTSKTCDGVVVEPIKRSLAVTTRQIDVDVASCEIVVTFGRFMVNALYV